MKSIRKYPLLLLAAWPAGCVTTNVNQPPSVVERSPGYRSSPETVAHRSPAEGSPSEEDSYFAEASRRDAALKNGEGADKDENCACRPENQAPGYSAAQDSAPKREDATTMQRSDPGAMRSEAVRSEPVRSEGVSPRSDVRDAGRDGGPAVTPVSANQGNPGTPGSGNANANANVTSTGLDLTDYSESGTASWYGRDFDGRPTASGEPFDSRRLTGAHKTLPLGSVIVVKNLENNKEVILKVNDRGPFVKGRVLDVSEYASEVLNFKEKGLTRVSIRVIKKGELNEKGEGATALFFRRPESGTGGAELDQKANDRPAATEAQLSQMRKELKTDEDLTRFSVQIGLFNDLENAVRLKTYLGERYGQPASVYQRGKDYVVKIGSFNARYPAEQLKQRLEGDGYSGFITGPRH